MNDTAQVLPKAKKSVALSGVAAGNTALCTVGRSGNDLHYRGYDIHDLATKATFEEVAHLLVHEVLPTWSELNAYRARLKRLRGPRRRGVGTHVGELHLDLGDIVRVLFGFGARQEPGSFDIGLEHDVDETLRPVGRLLRQAADPPSRRQFNVAMFGGDIMGDDVEQRALAAAVAPDESDARPRRDSHRGIFDEEAAGDANRQIVDDQHGALYG
jgi:hypothetical protein